MTTRKKRVVPWLTLTVAQGNAIQLGGLLVGDPAEPHCQESPDLVAEEDEPEQGAQLAGAEHSGD